MAVLAGVSARTLRYYDRIGLLAPGRIGENGYRIYGGAQVDLLQQILFYRALGVPLADVMALLTAPDFDRQKTLERHMTALKQQKKQIEALIETVGQTICHLKGEINMSDSEKFAGFLQNMVAENATQYGAEIRAAYGNAAVDSANQMLLSMLPQQWTEERARETEILTGLRAAMRTGDPASAAAQAVCELHGRWLRAFWKNGTYTKQAHRNLAQTYVDDTRFAAYYDTQAGDGAAQFLKAALDHYTRT